MKSLNIPITVKEIEFSLKSSHKEYNRSSKFYIQILLFKEEI
jgi:hypothetical protein